PVAVLGSFEERFLAVPAEALISTMKANQKYFHLVDTEGHLLPNFITIANVESKEPVKVRAGNERVVRPRLADAEFFWNQDRKMALAARVPALDGVVFQKQLGTLHHKSRRVAAIATHIAEQLMGDKQLAARAADLCKCDLMSEMVGEFPELQGTMGRYYAQHDGEPAEVAQAIEEHYLPRFAGDRLPDSVTGQTLAVADKLDTLVGIFAIGKIPSGDRDPFALRRAALGVLRTLIEKSLDLDLHALLTHAAAQFDPKIKASAAVPAVFDYMMERLRAYYQERDIGVDVLEAVISRKPTRPLDIDRRIRAVDAFRRLPEAQSLAAANKRIGNILKQAEAPQADSVDSALLKAPQESALYDTLTQLSNKVNPLLASGKFDDALKGLAGLREPVDAFFDHVLVMDEDQALRNNRVAMLGQLHKLFLRVADVSKLQS
ncbi:MAG: glycine--tRNA ligase subunit beta, partial [Pseudomonadota bacterium]